MGIADHPNPERGKAEVHDPDRIATHAATPSVHPTRVQKWLPLEASRHGPRREAVFPHPGLTRQSDAPVCRFPGVRSRRARFDQALAGNR